MLIFSLFGKLSVSFPAYMKITLIKFLLQVYALVCKQTSIFHKPASFRKCLLLLLLSNALKWEIFLLVEVLQIHGKTEGVVSKWLSIALLTTLLYNISP